MKKKIIGHIEGKVKPLYGTFPQQSITRLIDVLKKEQKTAEKFHVCLKKVADTENKMLRDHCHYTSLYLGEAHNNCNLKYQKPDHIPIVFHNLSGYDAHLFIRKLGKS